MIINDINYKIYRNDTQWIWVHIKFNLLLKASGYEDYWGNQILGWIGDEENIWKVYWKTICENNWIAKIRMYKKCYLER